MNAEEQKPRLHQSWIAGFLDYTSGIPSPEIFRKWSAIATIAGALERRVWISLNAGNLYPNLFILLVAPPGVGKSQAISRIYDFWGKASLNIAPVSLTHKGLVDHLASDACVRSAINEEGKLERFHSVLIAASEFGVLLPSHDLAFLNTLNDLFDCGELYEERTRTGGEIRIEKPHISLIGGTQPKYLGTIFPEAAYGMGFTSRIIMVYSGEPVRTKVFGKTGLGKSGSKVKDSLVSDLKQITALKGEFTVDDDAIDAIEAWFEAFDDAPAHSRLQHYNARRLMHALKLSQVFAVSSGNALVITKENWDEALATLKEAEVLMPEIFKEISTGSSASEMEECWLDCMKVYMKNKIPISESYIVNFLSRRVPVNQVTFILETMIKSGMLEVLREGKATPGGKFEPRLFKPLEPKIDEKKKA